MINPKKRYSLIFISTKLLAISLKFFLLFIDIKEIYNFFVTHTTIQAIADASI
jgi:hypothetical protein